MLKYVNGEPVEMTPEEEAAFTALQSEPPPVPGAVTPRQIRLALLQGGLSAQVDAYVATLTGAEQIEWEYASLIERDNALIAAAQTALELTNEEADDLFRLAATL